MASATISKRRMENAEEMEERGVKIEDSGSYGGGFNLCKSTSDRRTYTSACDRLPTERHGSRSKRGNLVRKLVMDPASRFIKHCIVKLFNPVNRKRSFEEDPEGQEKRKKARALNYVVKLFNPVNRKRSFQEDQEEQEDRKKARAVKENCVKKLFDPVCKKRNLQQVEVQNAEQQQGPEQGKKAKARKDNALCPNDLSSSLTENMRNNSFSSTSSTPLECPETILQILGHLEQMAPLNSVEAQLTIARTKPLTRLTVSMLNERARRSLDSLDEIPFLDTCGGEKSITCS